MYSCTVICGRCTSDIELRTTPNGVPVASFSVAVDRPFSKEKQSDFYTVVAWRQQGEFASKYFSKGSPILVQGTMQSRKYQDKQGVGKIAWELMADKISFTGNKSSGSPSDAGPSAPETAPAANSTDGFAEIEDDEDFPF